MQNLLLILLMPLAGFIISGLLGKRMPEKLIGWISSLSILIAFVLSFMVFTRLNVDATSIKQMLFTFLSVGDLNVAFELQADRLTAIMMMVITGIGFLIHVYSISYMHGDAGFYKFFAYLNLFVFNMLVLVMGANFLMLFFGWEGVGLCSYLLIGFWYSNVDYGKAARKAFIMNRIGDLGLLLGLFLIVKQFGSLDYDIVFAKVQLQQFNPEMVNAICILLFIGAMGKSAQIPLYTWLPDAMAGPTPVSALIHAATMVTAGIYLVVRCHILYDFSVPAREFIMWIGLATSILAALIGLKQNDIKKVLAYSTVSQLGLMFIALGVGAYSAAMFHLITHAFFKALLFLGSGSVIHAMGGEQDIRKMGGLKKSMPITYWTFLLGTLAICGTPFFSGFFSKDEILASAFSHNTIVWALALGSALITCIYMFRVFMVTFLGGFRGTEEQKHHLHESPALITIPLLVLAVLSVFGGVLNLPHLLTHGAAQKLKTWLNPVLEKYQTHMPHELSHTTEWMLIGSTLVVLIIAFVYTYTKYINGKVVPESDEAILGIGKVLSSKFYVDEAYDAAVTAPVNHLGDFTYKWIDRKVIDGIVNFTGVIVKKGSDLYGKIQTGNLENYLMYMVIGIIVILGLIIVK
ncbi:MAG: NADH-quinone oxidoreductase subunit L [Bacteroidota bacterium]|jgi:NADH-quinone oxidoreductase subunit L